MEVNYVQKDIFDEKIRNVNARADYDRERTDDKLDKIQAVMEKNFIEVHGEIKKNDYMSNKDKGTLYERFIGEIYQKAGYKVENNGIEKGSHDGGIDLICRSDNYTVLVQCKNYKSPSLSVKDIYQFYGACRHYAVKNPSEIVSGAFFISKPLSKYYDAFRAAVDLGITLYDGYAMPNDAN